MCSKAEEEEITHMKPEKQSTEYQACVKCGEPGCVITRVQDSFCKSCFQVYVVHKFRAAIGKSKLIRDGERVLVALSGGHNSCALLHLIQDGLSKRAHKKLRFTPVLLHIDESGVSRLSQDDKSPFGDRVAEIMLKSGYPSYVTTLEMGLSVEEEIDKDCCVAEGGHTEGDNLIYWEPGQHQDQCSSSKVKSARERLKSVLSGLASVSSQDDFIHNLRNQLIANIARHTALNKVLMADSSTRLAVRILADIAQGRGSQVALNTGFSDARRGDVLFLRPVRDLTSKELILYNRLFEVDSTIAPTLCTGDMSSVCVERLTRMFVTGLQRDYFSTVSNIVRTSEKLGLPEFNGMACCWFCQSPLDTLGGNTSVLRAVEVSLQLSQGTGWSEVTNDVTGSRPCGEGQDSQELCCGKGNESCHSKPQLRLTTEDLNPGLCYGCRLSLRDFRGELGTLPDFITQKATLTKQREKLREEIADYLLEDHNAEEGSS